ncbi:aminodeoxychorismate lyase [Thaumasiovibrio subtropicus]|uniref:aminodeoxychorismate lyase n=1 Tax=Thaumasiovibrio subtropicus TaxID=1891207 RepID=UPI000B34C5FD|nr:aminodeoxychorismate lyase [Thaumasiovibrio subtropicus]
MPTQIRIGQEATISITDRGFQYGDGCFSTIAVKFGKVCHWTEHLRRFEDSLQRLAIKTPDWNEISAVLTALARDFANEGVIKVVITRGQGGRGYATYHQDHDFEPNVVITSAPMPSNYEKLRRSGIQLGICQQPLGVSPMLAGMKHLNRLEQVVIRREIDANGWQDALVTNTDGHVIETGLANLFWEKSEQLFTPNVGRSGVAGVMRDVVIAKANEQGVSVSIVDTSISSLLEEAESLFICNSLMGAVPVTAIENRVYPKGALYCRIAPQLFQ